MNRAVGALVNYNGKYLLGKKKSDSLKKLAGMWHLLGEGVNEGESDEDALKRGLREEAGLDVRVGRKIASGITPTSRREINWYECFALTDDVHVGSDLEDIGWFSKREILEICSERIHNWPPELKDYFLA